MLCRLGDLRTTEVYEACHPSDLLHSPSISLSRGAMSMLGLEYLLTSCYNVRMGVCIVREAFLTFSGVHPILQPNNDVFVLHEVRLESRTSQSEIKLYLKNELLELVLHGVRSFVSTPSSNCSPHTVLLQLRSWTFVQRIV